MVERAHPAPTRTARLRLGWRGALFIVALAASITLNFGLFGCGRSGCRGPTFPWPQAIAVGAGFGLVVAVGSWLTLRFRPR